MNLLFDLDGTLTDPFEGITKCISFALVALGYQAPELDSLRWCIGPPIRENFAKLLGSEDTDLIERAVHLYRERFSEFGLFENEIYPGIPEALETLTAKGCRLYVATSKPRVYAEHIIEHFGLKRFFKAIFGSQLDGGLSDKRSLISHILHKDSLDSRMTVMVGDREHDMIGAEANGLSGIGVLWGYGTITELEAAGALACIMSPDELEPLVRKMENKTS
jgi:phosphoglycolate phosphatase